MKYVEALERDMARLSERYRELQGEAFSLRGQVAALKGALECRENEVHDLRRKLAKARELVWQTWDEGEIS